MLYVSHAQKEKKRPFIMQRPSLDFNLSRFFEKDSGGVRMLYVTVTVSQGDVS